MLEGKGLFDTKYRYTCMLRQQFQFFGRGDDVCHLEREGLRHHPDFDFALSQKVEWSKNVLEERECPPQILLGAMDPDWCVLLSLGLYLEAWCREGNGRHSHFLYCDGETEADGNKLKARYSKKLKKVFDSAEFQDMAVLMNGPCGVHSLRKFPSTWARQNGCTVDEIEIRGRWKASGGGRKRVVGRYIDPEQAFIDTKVAAALCVDGAVKYRLKPDSNICRNWIRGNVVPGIDGAFPADNNIADVLGIVVLWACFDQRMRERVPQFIKDQVDIAYPLIRALEPDVNPVEKVALEVYRVGEQVSVFFLV